MARRFRASSLQPTSGAQQPSSTGQPHWLGQGLWGDTSIIPSTQWVNSGRGNRCNAKVAWGWPWQSRVWQGRNSQERSVPCTAPLISSLPSSCAQQSWAELDRAAVLTVLEENKCFLCSRASSGQLSISYRKNKWERGQKCPQAKQSNKRGKDRKDWSFQLGHHPFSVSLPPLTPSPDPLRA